MLCVANKKEACLHGHGIRFPKLIQNQRELSKGLAHCLIVEPHWCVCVYIYIYIYLSSIKNHVASPKLRLDSDTLTFFVCFSII